jgi:RHS repeat-associated protein
VTAAQFNGANRSDGIGFITRERRSVGEFLLQRAGKMVRVPRERESSHCMMMGDTGAGKSSLIRQILMQVEERGETAIVYDPALEYTPQFYEPRRGDVILNPVDARMPYWSPCDEVQHEAEAEGLAAALFKDDPRTNPFFVMVPRQIFAHLLIEQPKRTPEELLAILRDERELAKRLKDTEHAAAIYPDAGPQRGGMIATLNSVSNALKLLPRRDEVKTSWTALEWAKHRQGWLFITSPPEFRERLRPLVSMWLDMLVLRMMNQGKPGVRPVWFILDELQSLHAVVSAAGVVENESEFYPFGGELQFSAADATNHYKFTGKERDSESGLDYFGARYYGSTLGRFLTPDWATKPSPVPYAEFGDPQSLNLYSYVRNIPTTKADPDGHCPECIVQLVKWAVGRVKAEGFRAANDNARTGAMKGAGQFAVDTVNGALAIATPGNSHFRVPMPGFLQPYGTTQAQAAAMTRVGMHVTSIVASVAASVATSAGSASTAATEGGPYSNLADSAGVGPGKLFTQAQKANIYEQNMANNAGVLRSDLDGQALVAPSKSQAGVTPPSNEAQVDHIIPRNPADPTVQPGSNSYKNAQVLSREQNIDKSNN